MIESSRYLVPFHPKRLPHFFADVLIIGGGLAGLRAANAVDPRLSVLIITKDEQQLCAGRHRRRARSRGPL
jgi:L-aspartate oxidase